MGYLRKSNSKDLRHVMANMRVMDKVEAYYQCGCEPEDALAESLSKLIPAPVDTVTPASVVVDKPKDTPPPVKEVVFPPASV